jgi:DNA-binding NtrC family response regulator
MSYNILIVDDEPAFRKMAKSFFDRTGYNTFFATNGLEAIEKVSRRDFDLIITDYRMPGLNGLNLISWVQEFKADTPVFLMTSYVNRDMYHLAMEAGAKAFLLKPINFANLVKKIKKQLNPVAPNNPINKIDTKKLQEPKLLN